MKRGAFFSLACLFALSPARSSAVTAPPTSGLSAWIVPWDPVDASADGCFEELNPFVFALSSAPALALVSPDFLETVSRRRRAGVLLVPVVVNDVYAEGKIAELKSDGALSILLSDPRRVARHIEELTKASRDFDGIEIDYERIPPKLWGKYVDFIERLGVSLHASDKKLYIDVETDQLRSKEWTRLARAVDRVKLMAYYENGGAAARPGPGSSKTWVVDMARQTLRVVPPEKLVVALSFAGTDWTPPSPETPSSWKGKHINYGQVMELRSKSGAEIRRDGSSMPFFHVVRDGREHEVWFEDEKSLADKIRALRAIGIKRIAVWYWGRKHPDADALGLCRP